MLWHISWLGLLWLLLLPCWSSAQDHAADLEAAEQWWTRGQDAIRSNRPDEAIRCYERSLLADPALVRNYLSLAAAYLQKGDQAGACRPLSLYVALNPEQLAIRAQYAELLVRLNRRSEAIRELRRYDMDALEQRDTNASGLVRCHRRLMELAEATHDDYSEHLHRGIGLYFLARQRAKLASDSKELPTQALFCKAAAELTLAQREQPSAARPRWYLYEVWSELGQWHIAAKALAAADQMAPFSYLAPAEQNSLHLALLRQHDMEHSH